MNDRRNFPLSDRESNTLFRALLEYRNALAWSRLAGSELVEEEIGVVDTLSERISLLSYYPLMTEETGE